MKRNSGEMDTEEDVLVGVFAGLGGVFVLSAFIYLNCYHEYEPVSGRHPVVRFVLKSSFKVLVLISILLLGVYLTPFVMRSPLRVRLDTTSAQDTSNVLLQNIADAIEESGLRRRRSAEKSMRVVATDLDVRGLSAARDNVGVWGTNGTVVRQLKVDENGRAEVNVVNTPTVTLAGGTITGTVSAGDAGTGVKPVLVGGTESNGTLRGVRVDSSGRIEISGTISATDLDVALTAASDSLTVYGSDDGGTTQRVIKTDAAGKLLVDGSAVTQPVSGTVTVNAGTGPFSVDAVDLDTRDLAPGTDGVLSYGSDDGGTTARVIKTDENGNLDVNIVSGGGAATSPVTSAYRTTANLFASTVPSDDGSTTITVASGEGGSFPAAPFYIRINNEFLQVTARDGDVLTVTRGVLNSTAVIHAADSIVAEVYDSTVLTLDGYTEVITKIACSHNLQLKFTWYDDSLGANKVRELNPPYTAPLYDFLSAPAFAPYVRYMASKTTAGTTTSLFFETEFSKTAISPQLLTLGSTVFSGMVSVVTRSVLVAQKADDSFTNIKATDNDELFTNTLASNRACTAFMVFSTSTTSPVTFFYGLVDLSDTTNYCHDETAKIVIDWIQTDVVVQTGSYIVDVYVGYFTSTSNVKPFVKLNYAAQGGGNAEVQYIDKFKSFQPGGIDTSRITSSVNIAFPTPGTITAPSGISFTPGIGDIVFIVDVTTSETSDIFKGSVTLGYHSQ